MSMRHSRWLTLILLALGIGILFLSSAQQPNNPVATLPAGADSTQVAKLRAAQPNTEGETAIVLLSSTDGSSVDPTSVLRALDTEGVSAPPIPNDDSSAIMMPFALDADSASESAERVNHLREVISDAAPAGTEASITGPAAIGADLADVFSGASFLLLGVTATIVAILLVITYRSPILWILPLLVIGVADRVAATLSTWVLEAAGFTWDESTLGILSVLVFGAGTNYALLLISRYRTELTKHADRFEAMAAAWAPTAKTVSVSALTVALGVGCLMLSLTPTTRGLGLASIVGIGVALVFAIFCLPGLLVFFGRWVFWPKRPEVGADVPEGIWGRIGARVQRTPARVALITFGALALASIGVTQISTGLNQSEQFINTPESITAAEDLADHFPGQSATPMILASQDPSALPDQARISGDPVEGWTIAQLSTDASVDDVRAQNPEVLVGGQEAELLDTESAAQRDRMLIFPLVLGLILLSLMVVLRSVLAPVIMVSSVILTNLAALGLGWWVSTGIFGFSSFDSTTALYSFVFLVALGIDYTIFLITRTRDEVSTLGTRKSLITALSATGGVITSAGILLAAVFAALGVLPLVVLAQIGIVICIGVLLDTLVVRTLLVPAVVQLLGEKFWWPARPKQHADA